MNLCYMNLMIPLDDMMNIVLLLLKNNSVLFNTFEISHFQISMWTKINSEFLYLSEPDCAYLYPQGNLNQKTCLHKN